MSLLAQLKLIDWGRRMSSWDAYRNARILQLSLVRSFVHSVAEPQVANSSVPASEHR